MEQHLKKKKYEQKTIVFIVKYKKQSKKASGYLFYKAAREERF